MVVSGERIIDACFFCCQAVTPAVVYTPFAYRAHCLVNMLGDSEDVFDSVTWETPSSTNYDNDIAIISSGPGFRQSTSESNEDPHQPKWEGYLLTTVKDPVKELADTKDAYVSYLVSAEVSGSFLWDIDSNLLLFAD